MKKFGRREFLKKIGKLAIGGAIAGALYKLNKEYKKQIIENAPEAIYYLLTEEKIGLGPINKRNYEEVLNNLKDKISEKLKIKGEIKKFDNYENFLSSLLKEKNKTVIILLWPTKEYPPTYEPSLGILENVSQSGFEVFDPNVGKVLYEETPKSWEKIKSPFIYLVFNKKIEISEESKEEVKRSILKSRERY